MSKRGNAVVAEEGTMHPSTGRSAIAIGILLLMVAAACFATRAFAAGSSAAYAQITDADASVQRMSLAQDATLTVTSSAGTNVVEVSAGAVRVTEASCPNHDCVAQGQVSEVGQQIVCLPNKLVVSIEGETDDGQAFDVVGS